MRFGTALAALSVLRYMTDYGNELPLGVMARMLDTHDTIVQLVPLLEERPWMRRCALCCRSHCSQTAERTRLARHSNEGETQRTGGQRTSLAHTPGDV